MDKLTTEQKAKRYDEVIEKLRSLLDDYDTVSTLIDIKEELENIFPELAETDDERIRRVIRGWIYTRPASFFDNGISKEVMLAWLEKQGDKPQGKSALEAIKEEKVDNQNCVKSVDGVKPKFKVGDWVVFDNGNVEHITSVGTHGYTFDDGDYLLHDKCDKDAHLWTTIQDAKDGDVLVFKNNIGGIIICKSPSDYDTRSYCRLIRDNLINKEESGWDSTLLVPATKKQRDTLFAKMKEAGYAFDFEKKELKKLGQPEVTKTSDQEEIAEIPFGAKDSELQEATYYIPKGFHAEIDDDKVVIKKGEKPAEWSEENEHRVKDTIYFLDTAKKHYASTVELDACIDWLKSLKQRIGG